MCTHGLLIDNKKSLRNHLQLGVDAIITNQPEKLANLIQTEFHDTLQLKNWEQIKSSEAIQPVGKAAIAGFSGFIAENIQAWTIDVGLTKSVANLYSDCHGDLKCSELLNQ